MFAARYFAARYFPARYFPETGSSSGGSTYAINRVETLPSESDVATISGGRAIIPPGVPVIPPDQSAFSKGGTAKPITASDSFPAQTDITNLGKITPPHYVQYWSYQTAAGTTEASSSLTLGTNGSNAAVPAVGNLLICLVSVATTYLNPNLPSCLTTAGWTVPTNGSLTDTNSGFQFQCIWTHTVTSSDPDLALAFNWSTADQLSAQIWVLEVAGAGNVDLVTTGLATPTGTPWASPTGTGSDVGHNDVGIVLASIADGVGGADSLSGYTMISSQGNHGDGGVFSYGNTAAVFVTNSPVTTMTVPSQNVGWSSFGSGNEFTMGQQILLYPKIDIISATDTAVTESDTARMGEGRSFSITDTAAAVSETVTGPSSHHTLGPIPVETAAQFADSGILYNTRGAIMPVDTTRITESASFSSSHVLRVSETDLESDTPPGTYVGLLLALQQSTPVNIFQRVKPFLASDTATAISDYARFRDTNVRITDTAATISETVSFLKPRQATVGDTALRMSDMPTIGVTQYQGPPLTPNLGATRGYRVEIYNLSQQLVAIPQDIIAGWFEDAINGGNTQGYLRFARPFEDISWITYECRVKFYMSDSVDPWWDGRVIEFDQEQIENADAEYIDLQLEGWKTRLAYAITSDSLNPGVQSNGQNNGTMTADTWLRALLGGNSAYGMPGYLDTSTFAPLDAGTVCPAGSIPINLNQISYDGTGLDDAINTVVAQILDTTGNSYEWWVRGSATGKPCIVIQPNQNPNTVATGYTSPSVSGPTSFIYDWKDGTTNAYTIQNNGQNLYNMIVLFGGTDPSTQQQIWGSFQDSTSISLYGARQKKVTNSVLLSQTTLSNYATSYLLQNGYPQPQGQYRKMQPTDGARAGRWIQVFMPSYINGNQVIQQVRATKVRIDFGSSVPESLIQTISVAAPRPYIDIAFYQAVAQSTNAAALAATLPSANVANYYVVSGFNWVGVTNGIPPASATVKITPPAGLFSTSSGPKLVQMAAGTNTDGSINVLLTDSVTNASGDGTYYVMFCYDPLTIFGVGSHTPNIVVAKSSAYGAPIYNPEVLNGWSFTVLGGQVIGDRDLRVTGGIQAANFSHLPSGSVYSAPTYTGTPTIGTTPGLSGLSGNINVSNVTITNVPQDGLVAYFAFFYRVTTVGNTNPWALWGQIPLPGLPLPTATAVVGEIFADFTAGSYFDFGGAFVGIGGDINTASGISAFSTNVQATVLGIQVGYMQQINGNSQAYSPLVQVQSGPSAVGNVGGVSSNVTINWTLQNQPTDGSASKVAYWTRNYDGNPAMPPYGYPGSWSKFSDAAINGLGANPLPSSAPYVVTFNDITNGNAWEFGVTVEDGLGNDAPFTYNGRGQVVPNPISFGVLSAQTLSVQGQAMPASIKTNGVTINTAATYLGAQTSGTTTTSASQAFNIQVNASDYGGTFGNTAPTWLNSMIVVTRSSTTQTLTGTQVTLGPNPQGDYNNSIAIPSNAVVDIGCYYQDQVGGVCSQIAWFAFNVQSPQLNLDDTDNGAVFYANVAGTDSAANVVTNGTMFSGSGDANHGNIAGSGTPGDNLHGWLYNWQVEVQSPERASYWENYASATQPDILSRLLPNSLIQNGEHSYTQINSFEKYICNVGDTIYINTAITVAANTSPPAGCQSACYSGISVTYADGSVANFYNNSITGYGNSVGVGNSFTLSANAAGQVPKTYQVLFVADFYNGSGAAIQLGNYLYQDARFNNVLVNRASSLQAEVFGQLNLGSNSSVVAGQNGSAINGTGGLAGVGFAGGTHGAAGDGSGNPFEPIAVSIALPPNSAGGGSYNLTATYVGQGAYGSFGIYGIGVVNQGGFNLGVIVGSYDSSGGILLTGTQTLSAIGTAAANQTVTIYVYVTGINQGGGNDCLVTSGTLSIIAVRTS